MTAKRAPRLTGEKVLPLLLSLVLVVVGAFALARDAWSEVGTTAEVTAVDDLLNGVQRAIGAVDPTDVTYKEYVTYTVDGRTYKNVELPGYEHTLRLGQAVPIRYIRSDPAVVDRAGIDWLATFALAGGLVVGAAVLFLDPKTGPKEKWK